MRRAVPRAKSIDSPSRNATREGQVANEVQQLVTRALVRLRTRERGAGSIVIQNHDRAQVDPSRSTRSLECRSVAPKPKGPCAGDSVEKVLRSTFPGGGLQNDERMVELDLHRQVRAIGWFESVEGAFNLEASGSDDAQGRWCVADAEPSQGESEAMRASIQQGNLWPFDVDAEVGRGAHAADRGEQVFDEVNVQRTGLDGDAMIRSNNIELRQRHLDSALTQ